MGVSVFTTDALFLGSADLQVGIDTKDISNTTIDDVVICGPGWQSPPAASRCTILLSVDGHLPDDFGHPLLGVQTILPERFCSPVISDLRAGVYSSTMTSFRPPEVLCGPHSMDGLKTWPRSLYQGLGHRVWRDDPKVSAFVADAIQGKCAAWISPGFPFSVPDEPLELVCEDGVLRKGLLCSSMDEPGGWVLLTSVDISRLLGLLEPVHYEALRRTISMQTWSGLILWAKSLSLPA